FQRMWALYAVAQKDPQADQSKLEAKWLDDLSTFVSKYPKSGDTPEALFQLGMYQELLGKTDEANKRFQQLVQEFPKAGAVEKAKGAIRRLGSLGKPMALRGREIQGGAVDIAKYRGKVVLVHYWGTIGSERWKQDMILLRDLYAKKAGPD